MYSETHKSVEKEDGSEVIIVVFNVNKKQILLSLQLRNKVFKLN